MNSKLMTPFLLILLSCSSTKQANAPVEKISEKKTSLLTLPVHLDFTTNPPHDSVIKLVNAFFNNKDIQMIASEKMSGLIQAEAQAATQRANIKSWTDPEEVMRQVERQTKDVANRVRVDFSFVDHASNQFRLKWYHERMPMRLTTYKKGEWTQVDSSLIAKYPWPESLRIAVESIISSGKLK